MLSIKFSSMLWVQSERVSLQQVELECLHSHDGCRDTLMSPTQQEAGSHVANQRVWAMGVYGSGV